MQEIMLNAHDNHTKRKGGSDLKKSLPVTIPTEKGSKTSRTFLWLMYAPFLDGVPEGGGRSRERSIGIPLYLCDVGLITDISGG